MAFGIGIITVGVLSVLIGFLPERLGRAVRGAGRTTTQLIVGAALIVVGIIVLVAS